jgi:agmatine deiminase
MKTETVNLFVRNQKTRQKAISMFNKENINLNQIQFHIFDYADVWFRDYGPTFVTNKQSQLGMVHWIFNCWGEKYEDS